MFGLILKIIDADLFPQKPYEMQGSFSFMEAAKLGDLKTCKLLLSRNKYLVYNFDYVRKRFSIVYV